MKTPACITKTVITLSVVSLAHLAPRNCIAEEWHSEELNCAVTLPTGGEWTQPSVPNSTVRAVAQTNDQTASVFLMVVPLPNGSKLDDKFIQGYEDGHYQPGKSKKLSGARLIIQGVPAYKSIAELYVNGNTVQQVGILWIADGKLYQLSALKRNAPPLEDPAIRAFMASFHFLKSPSA